MTTSSGKHRGSGTPDRKQSRCSRGVGLVGRRQQVRSSYVNVLLGAGLAASRAGWEVDEGGVSGSVSSRSATRSEIVSRTGRGRSRSV